MFNPFYLQHGKFGTVRTARDLTVLEDVPSEFDVTDGGDRAFLTRTIPNKRFVVGGVIVCIGLSLLLGRAIQLQIVEGDLYAAKAESNRVRSMTLVPPRGIVFDRFGNVLIQNVPAFVASMTYADLSKDVDLRELHIARAADLAGVARTDIDMVMKDARKDPYESFVIKKGLSYEAAMRFAIEEPTLPGFYLTISTVREYERTAPSLSHTLGYTGNISEDEYADRKADGYRPVDEIGKNGIERSAESFLRGTPGMLRVEVDARGDERSVSGKTEPIAGENLTLTIDLPLQTFIEQRVQAVLEKLNLTRASVVAIDPRNGAIRALVSIPSYDSNAFAGGIDSELYQSLLEDENHPLFARAIAGEFPPGSTFKPFVAYGALAEGIVTPSTSFISSGGIRIGEWFFPDWKAGGHGVTDVRTALAWSVNTYFYVVGGGFDQVTGLGVERITDNARLFGFGEKTGVDLPGEADGFLPSKEWKQEVKNERWYIGDTYHLAIGQGDMLTTPLQLAVANATIANGGTRFTPHLIEKMGYEIVAQKPVDVSLNTDSVQVVREGMRQAVMFGSARFLSYLALPVAGKTGTAQASGDVPTHAWFEGFGPYTDPTLSIVILIENGGEGSSVAVPIAKDIFEWWFANR